MQHSSSFSSSLQIILSASDLYINDKGAVTFAMVTMSICLAFISAVVKAIMVEHCAKMSLKYATFVQVFYHLVYFSSSLTFGWLGGYFLTHIPKKSILGIAAVIPLFVVITAIFLKEKGRDRTAGPGKVVALIWQATFFSNEIHGLKVSLWRPMLFVLVYSMCPSPSDAMFFYYTDMLFMRPDDVAMLNLMATIFGLVCVATYLFTLSTASPARVIFWALFASIFANALPILVVSDVNTGMAPKNFLLMDQAFVGLTQQLMQLPLLILGVRLCPPGMEATIYGIIMALLNIGALISGALSGGIMDAMHISRTNFNGMFFFSLFRCCFLFVAESLVRGGGGGGG